ncbi:uncharacterized protein LOC132204610 [Neocloeon triangulifer]|uniref:uncharacterized protein LOC132204610 n=1 Tax=Neocloeon triangulifer TaxID=2078957 RepID=UPI00286EEE5B|nr:uncharacterized protein LOC132204610 [Neocloeon triangulifer]
MQLKCMLDCFQFSHQTLDQFPCYLNSSAGNVIPWRKCATIPFDNEIFSECCEPYVSPFDDPRAQSFCLASMASSDRSLNEDWVVSSITNYVRESTNEPDFGLISAYKGKAQINKTDFQFCENFIKRSNWTVVQSPGRGCKISSLLILQCLIQQHLLRCTGAKGY